MTGRTRRALLFVILVAITIGCLVWVFRGVAFGEALAALSTLEPSMVVGALAALTALLGLRAWRYQLLLEQRVPTAVLLSVVSASFLALNVVPMRMGELVRPVLLAEHAGVPFGSGAAAVVLERLLDMLGLLGLLALVTVLVDVPGGAFVVGDVDLFVMGRRALATALVIGAVGVVGAMVFGERILGALVRAVAPAWPGLARRLNQVGSPFVGGLRHLASRPGRAAVSVVATVAIWTVNGASMWFILGGFDAVSATLDLVLLNYAGAAVAVVLLPTPGFFGAYELGSASAMRLMGTTAAAAATAALTMHVLQFAHTVVMGLIGLATQGWSLSAAVRDSRPPDAG